MTTQLVSFSEVAAEQALPFRVQANALTSYIAALKITIDLFAAANADDGSRLGLLLDKHPDFIDVRNGRDQTLLHVIALKGLKKAYDAIIDRGPDLNARTYGSTPYTLASRYGHEEIASDLARRLKYFPLSVLPVASAGAETTGNATSPKKKHGGAPRIIVQKLRETALTCVRTLCL